MSKYNKAIGDNIDFSGNCVATTETKEELAVYIAEKMDIIDDFLIGKHKLKATEKRQLEKTLSKIKTKRGIDIYFRTYLDAHM